MGLGRVPLVLRTPSHYSPLEVGNHTARDSYKSLVHDPKFAQASVSEIPFFLSLLSNQHLTPTTPMLPPKILIVRSIFWSYTMPKHTHIGIVFNRSALDLRVLA